MLVFSGTTGENGICFPFEAPIRSMGSALVSEPKNYVRVHGRDKKGCMIYIDSSAAPMAHFWDDSSSCFLRGGLGYQLHIYF